MHHYINGIYKMKTFFLATYMRGSVMVKIVIIAYCQLPPLNVRHITTSLHCSACDVLMLKS